MINIITAEDDADMWDGKVNFVDTNNVLVGYDTSTSCCEMAEWYITDRIAPITSEMYEDGRQGRLKGVVTGRNVTPDLDGYVFDPSFCVKGSETFGELNKEQLDEGDQVFFAMVHPEKEKLFLCLYNSHNGYYSHGFELVADGKTVWSDSI